MKYIVRVAWNQEAVDIAIRKGMDFLFALQERRAGFYLDFADVREFNTEAEARAYMLGIEEGNGWNEPYAELTIKESTEAHYTNIEE